MSPKNGTGRRIVDLFSGRLPLAVLDHGFGERSFLLLHGGAGLASMSGLGVALASTARTIVPTHPGFEDEPQPDFIASLKDLVRVYLALLDTLELANVVIVGNSLGGWIAAELALLGSPRVVGLVLIDAAGISADAAEKGLVNPRRFAPAERMALAFHDADRFSKLPSSPAAHARIAAHEKTIDVYAGNPFMQDPTLRARLSKMPVPALVLWGASDRILDPNYGRTYANCIPAARFEVIAEAGHFPQVEQLGETRRLITNFSATLPRSGGRE